MRNILAAGALAGAVALGCRAATLTDQEHTDIAEPRPADVPDDAALEAAGAVIGAIDIQVHNVFDAQDPREANVLYRLADHLHVSTRPWAIKSQLLFASGDKYRGQALSETERNLRKLPYLYDARVYPVRYADGRVEVRVSVRDVWTLSPGFNLGRAGGSNNFGINVQDSNFLGTGKSVTLAHLENVDRTSNELLLNDPNVFSSRWTLTGAFVDSSDGKQRTLQVAQPFYSLNTPWAANAGVNVFDRTISRYSAGEIVDQFNDNETTYDLGGGLSSGLQNGWTRRWLAGVHYDANYFVPTPNSAMPAIPLPPDRVLSYPYVGFDILQDDYRKLADQNQIGRTEDFYYGTEISGQVGLSSTSFGADLDAVMLAAAARSGYQLSEHQELFLSAVFSTRVEQGRLCNLIATGTANYYWRWRTNWLLFSTLSATTTNALDPDTQLLIGGDSGLRGYPLRYEAGTQRALWTVEQRFFTDWYPFRLTRVGGAVFADVGRTWGQEVVGNSDAGLLKDVGFGLRFGSTRSGLGNVVHVDLAFPLNPVAGVAKVQLLIQTLQSF